MMDERSSEDLDTAGDDRTDDPGPDPEAAQQEPEATEQADTADPGGSRTPASGAEPSDLPTSGELDEAPRQAVVTETAEGEPDADTARDGGEGPEEAPDDLDELIDIAGADAAATPEPGQDRTAAQHGDEPGEKPAGEEAGEEPADSGDEATGEGPAEAAEEVPGEAAEAADEVTGEEATEAADEVLEEEAAEEDEEEVRLRRPTSVRECRERRDLLRLPGDFFVVHTYSGYEQRVKDNLESRVEALDAHDRIYEIIIPTDEVTEFKRGKKQTVQKKFLPGYVLVRMEMDDDTWGVVRNTPAVTGFVGPPGTKPVPLSLREVAETLKIPETLAPPAEEEEQVPAERQVPEIDLEVGETVRVTTGPFADFTGTIAEINLDQSKLRVMVSVFGRETPLELPFDNVAKL